MKLGILAVAAVALGLSGAHVVAQDAGKPTRGGIVVMSSDAEQASLDVAFANGLGNDNRIFRVIYENLFYQAVDGQYVPQLATDWTVSDDGLVLTFNIREGVKFHDGTPLNAAAVAFNFMRMIDPELNARNRAYYQHMALAEAVDEYTLKITLKQPSSLFLPTLANEPGSIASPAAIEKFGKEYGRNPVGTGPFKFAKWTSGEKLEFVRFEDYWGVGADGEKLPYLDGVEGRFNPDSVTKVIAAEAGTVHLVDTIQPRDYARIEANADLSLVEGPATPYNLISFNTTVPPFDNVNLRKALTAAIDRESMLGVIYPGTGIVMKGVFPDYVEQHPENMQDYVYDPELAKKLYAESGHDGTPFKLALIQRDPDTTIAQILQAQWQAVGIPVTIELFERLAWTEHVYGHRYEVALHRIGGATQELHMESRYGRNAGADHTGQTILFDLIDEIQITLDPVKLEELYTELQQTLVDEALQMPMLGQRDHWIVNKKVQGIVWERNGNNLLTSAWLQQ